MNYELVKEKNILILTAEGKNKPYRFDINTGILYSTVNKPMVRCPEGLPSFARYSDNNVMVLLATILRGDGDFWFKKHTLPHMTNYAKLFKIVDRLESIGYKDRRGYDDPRYLEFIDVNFKDFAKYVKEYPEKSIEDFTREYEIIYWMKKNNIKETPYVTIEELEHIRRGNFDEKDLPYIINYFNHGIKDYYTTAEGYDGSMYAQYGIMFSQLRTYFEMCNDLEKKPTKDDFFRDYINTIREYRIKKANIDDKKIKEQYQKYPALAFENDIFKVIIPQTVKDFTQEANEQRNCVQSIYLSRVIRGMTNVVFIRRKDNIEHSYITCEVTNDGKINQYLGKGNSYVHDMDAIDFNILYQTHLKNNW